jgi:hypothetical protein
MLHCGMKFKNHDFREEELRKGIVDSTYKSAVAR